jgi:exodeoxyribonuclease VII large subunit
VSMWAEQHDFEAPDEPSLEPAPLTVSAYAARVQLAVKRAGSAVVEGEVRDTPRITPGGMLFFSLTDGRACMTCKVFRRDRLRLDHRPEEGHLIKVRVDRPDFYPTNGRLTLIVSQVGLAGEGELLKRRALLLKKLTEEGLTDPSRRRPLPGFPRAVGVIAGPQAVTDVVRALQDRYPPVHMVVCPSQVQGAGAPAQVIDALARLQQHPLVDVILIARGGGSVHELVAFDDEGLCRAIFACDKPVVAAIGHTDNVPVCNHVTWAAHTPSRAPEMLVPDAARLRREIELAGGALALVPDSLEGKRYIVTAFSRDVGPSRPLDAEAEAVLELGEELRESVAARTMSLTNGLTKAGATLRVVPHRLPDRTTVTALGAEVDRRAHGVFSGYRVELADCGRTLADTASVLADRRRRAVEAADRVATGIRRQEGLHERNYGRALSRLLGQARTGVARALSNRGRDVAREADPLGRPAQRRLGHARTSLGHVVAIIGAHDLRGRGWLLAEDETGTTVSSVKQVEKGRRLRLRFRDGRARARVEEIEEDTRGTTRKHERDPNHHL